MTDETSNKTSDGAVERMRLCRRRRQQGAVYLSLLLDKEAIDDLISLSWLDPKQRKEKRAVRSALIRFTNRAIELRVTPNKERL